MAIENVKPMISPSNVNAAASTTPKVLTILGHDPGRRPSSVTRTEPRRQRQGQHREQKDPPRMVNKRHGRILGKCLMKRVCIPA
jgi:hypothetical protein